MFDLSKEDETEPQLDDSTDTVKPLAVFSVNNQICKAERKCK